MGFPDRSSPDTTLDADRFQVDVYRRLGTQGRAEVLFRLNDLARSMAVAGIKARHPDYDDDGVRLAYARLVLGEELAAQVWPDRPLPAP